MIHHVSLGTADVGRARAFYLPVLQTVGLRLLKSDASALHFGVGDIAFSVQKPSDGGTASTGRGVHVAFAAHDRAMVERFYRTALEHGGTDDGAPGTRAQYDAHYYAAFVRDPDGNKLEAVTLSSK